MPENPPSGCKLPIERVVGARVSHSILSVGKIRNDLELSINTLNLQKLDKLNDLLSLVVFTEELEDF